MSSDALPGQGPREPVEAVAADELGDQVGPVLALADAVDGDDVGVLQPGDGARLDEEAGEGLVIERGDELHRDEALEQGVLGEVDAPDAPATEGPQQAVLVELPRRLPVRAGGGVLG